MDTALTETPDAPPRPADTPPAESAFSGPTSTTIWPGPYPTETVYSLAEPTFEEAHYEWIRFYQIPQGEIDPGGMHIGQFVACFDGIIRGFDPDPLTLTARVAAELGIHPARIVISYFG
jgi:hypothetical protein